MGKHKIDFFDSVQFTGDWDFVKDKKQRIKAKSEKTVNSDFYITFKDPNALYLFLYLTLAPQQSFEFKKAQPIIQKLKGTNEEQNNQFEECKKALNINWDGSTPLPDLIRKNKEQITQQQKNLLQISSRITDEEVIQLLKSGLSQRKIHLDFHTSDGQSQEQIIPAVQNINDCVTIIADLKKNKWLLAFFAHIQQQQKQKVEQNEQKKNQTEKKAVENPDDRKLPPPKQPTVVAQTFVDRPLPEGPVPNPDDRPLNPPLDLSTNNANRRPIQNPDDRPLNPPDDYKPAPTSKPVPTVPRQILDPDQKLLVPPSSDEPDQRGADYSDLKVVGKSYGQKVAAEAHQIGQKVVDGAHRVGQKVSDGAHYVGGKVADGAHYVGGKVYNVQQKAEKAVESIVDQIKNDKHHWISFGIAAGIIGLAIMVLRK